MRSRITSFLNFLNSSFKKSHYRKVLLFYSIFTLCIITTSSFILISYFNNALTNESKVSNIRFLTQIRIYSDTMLRKSVYSLLNTKFIDICSDENVFDFFSGNKSNDLEVLNRLYRDLWLIAADNNIIESIYVYRNSDSTLVSSKEGICISVSSSENIKRKYINFKPIEEIMLSSQRNKWICPVENRSFWESKPVISFVSSVPLLASENNILGYVVINIDETRFYESINLISETNPGEFMVIDSSGRILMHSDKEKVFELNAFNNHLIDIAFIHTKPNGFKVINMKDEYYGVTWSHSLINDWVYITITPMSILNSRVFLAKQIAVVLSILIALLALLGLRFITLILYKPLKHLVNITKDKFNIHNSNDNELAVIENVIKKLSKKVDEMQETIQSNQGIIKYRTALDIINGNILEINELNKRLEIINYKFPYDSFCIMITELDSRSLKLLSPEQQEYILYKIIDIISDVFCYSNSKHLSISITPTQIVTIINFDNYNYIHDNLPLLLQKIVMHTCINCNIAISTKTNDIRNLRNLFECSKSLLKYSFIHNYGNIFIQDVIDNLEKNSKIFDFSLLDDIEVFLKSCKISSVKEKISNIFLLIRTENYTYDHIQNITTHLISIFCKIIKEQDIDKHIDINNLLRSYNKITSLDEFQQLILQLIDVYDKSIASRYSKIDTEFINKIVTYISENIENQLTLNSVAKEFEISPNYLSKIFKEGTGINFSEFLTQEKLRKAKELLITDKKSTVDNIAKKLGYFNTTYFISLFKENFGITPAKFRKEYILNKKT